MGEFCCDYKNLTLSFNEFHDIKKKDRPEYGEFCLLELKNGDLTAGAWCPDRDKKGLNGKFNRGTADSVPASEVSKWHSLERYDMSNCLEQEDLNLINLGVPGEGIYSLKLDGFKALSDGDLPKTEQYCLLVMKDGTLAAGRWDGEPGDADGGFIYASALSCYDASRVWLFRPLSSDRFFLMEEIREKERKQEEELNKKPSVDPNLFKYGTDINVYYEKALEKLRKDYSWATLNKMKKTLPLWEIVANHGRLVFAQVDDFYRGFRSVTEWTEGKTADEFIDFLCEYTKQSVIDSNPEEKFKLGRDIEPYLERAYENVKKDYRWLERKMIEKICTYDIKTVDGDLEFVRKFKGDRKFYVCEYSSAERFIKSVENTYADAALSENPVVSSYDVPFGHVDICGWNLERYTFYRLKTGDYKVSVTAGDRVTGGSRDFFITPSCFEAKTYEEFLNRYLEIVQGYSFGLNFEDLIKDKDLKEFLGY